MTTTEKAHSSKRTVLRVVLTVVIVFALLAAAVGFHWVYDMYLAFNNPVLTGSDFFGSGLSLDQLDKLTDSDKAMVKKLFDENNIPYKEAFDTTIFVRFGKYKEASDILINSGYEFDGTIYG